jgi:hypothetical protein
MVSLVVDYFCIALKSILKLWSYFNYRFHSMFQLGKMVIDKPQLPGTFVLSFCRLYYSKADLESKVFRKLN